MLIADTVQTLFDDLEALFVIIIIICSSVHGCLFFGRVLLVLLASLDGLGRIVQGDSL